MQIYCLQGWRNLQSAEAEEVTIDLKTLCPDQQNQRSGICQKAVSHRQCDFTST